MHCTTLYHTVPMPLSLPVLATLCHIVSTANSSTYTVSHCSYATQLAPPRLTLCHTVPKAVAQPTLCHTVPMPLSLPPLDLHCVTLFQSSRTQPDYGTLFSLSHNTHTQSQILHKQITRFHKTISKQPTTPHCSYLH
jgi:hypothetical protein